MPIQVIPLGGCGEFGRNATAYVIGTDSVLIDYGMQLPDDLSPGIERFVPRLDGVLPAPPRALLLTHGHDDHLGAVPYLLKALPAPLPVYGTPLTLRLLSQHLDRERVPRKLTDLRAIVPGEPVFPIQAGALRVLPVTMTHSIPGACGFWISARDTTVLHTGDFKLEGDLDDLGALAGPSCDLLVSDSTNATRPGRSGSEPQVQAALAAVLAEATGRVALALFSSHVERIAHFASSCARAGRRLCLLGRGLLDVVQAARAASVFSPPVALLCDEAEAARLPPGRLAVLCTGSQGEPEAALMRLLPDSPHQGRSTLRLAPGDTVVLASRTIPGSERAVGRLVDRLLLCEVEVREGPAYTASGHACQDELLAVLRTVRPRALLPVHGTRRHLVAHARLAQGLGIEALLCQDGDVIEVGESIRRAGRVPAGRVAVEGRTCGQTGGPALWQRRQLARSGVVLAAVSGSRVSVRACGVCDPGPVLDALCAEAELKAAQALSQGQGLGQDLSAEAAVRQAVRRVFFRARGIRPVVVVA